MADGVLRANAGSKGNGDTMQVFHAGTSSNDAGEVVATGGRVLGVTATSGDVEEAQKKAYRVHSVKCAVCRVSSFCIVTFVRKSLVWREGGHRETTSI